MSQVQFNSQLTDQVKVSDEAVKQLLALTESEDGVNGVRIFVSGGGCGGMSYGMTFVDQPTPFDTTLDKEGLKVHVDAVALGFLEGVEIDYQTEGDNASFVFKNVFANTSSGGACGGCGAALPRWPISMGCWSRARTIPTAPRWSRTCRPFTRSGRGWRRA